MNPCDKCNCNANNPEDFECLIEMANKLLGSDFIPDDADYPFLISDDEEDLGETTWDDEEEEEDY